MRTSASKRSADVVALLDDRGATYGATGRTRPLVAVADDGPIHTSKLTTRALAARPWITIEWSPTYAPELNVIEHRWGDLKRYDLGNRTFTAAADLARAIRQRVDRLHRERQTHPSDALSKAAYTAFQKL